MLFELAWKLSKDSTELLWWAIIGATEQLILDKVETSQYTIDSEQLHSHASRLVHRANDQQVLLTTLNYPRLIVNDYFYQNFFCVINKYVNIL